MPPKTVDLHPLAYCLDAILIACKSSKSRMRGLVTSQIVVAKEFVVKDDRAVIRARLEMAQYAPCPTFYDPAGKERLKIGLRTDSSPFVQVEQRDIPLG